MNRADPIELEVFRTRLEAIAEQAASTVEHTAISPLVTEGKDYSVTLVDAEGGVIVGAGILFHFGAVTHAVRSTIKRHGSSIRSGDLFMANDPHSGGGQHPQDVMVQQPIFVDDRLIAWIGISAHMIDVGGMVVGSFAPDATECYQEGIRFPSVRLFREGVEVTDMFDVFLNNVRMANIVEMDLRGLIAGCHLASERVADVVRDVGVEGFVDKLQSIRDLTEAEMRRRIELLEDGIYRSTSWTEFGTECYESPCALTVVGNRLIFDFTGAAPQTTHFFNSKPYIVKTELAIMLAWRFAVDLPFNEGIFACIEVHCPEGTILNALPPAPIAAAHMHASLNAATVAVEALTLAMGASTGVGDWARLAGPSCESGIGYGVFSWSMPNGETDAYVMQDGNWVGGSAGVVRDGPDLGRNVVGTRVESCFPDIEILESWYPLLFLERSARSGVEGAGTFRAGAGNQFSFRPHGISEITGTMLGMRRWVPLTSAAGGRPGSCNEFLVHHSDGSVDQAETHASGVLVTEDDWFQLRLPNGGGFGDPLDREPQSVADDMAANRYSSAEALKTYGVVFDSDRSLNLASTERTRNELRAERLEKAHPPKVPFPEVDESVTASSETWPIQPGVVQRGSIAFAERSGTPLAAAPNHWTDGCPVWVEPRWSDVDGPPVVFRTYLDPSTGRSLHVEVALADGDRSFEVSPDRWTASGRVASGV